MTQTITGINTLVTASGVSTRTATDKTSSGVTTSTWYSRLVKKARAPAGWLA